MENWMCYCRLADGTIKFFEYDRTEHRTRRKLFDSPEELEEASGDAQYDTVLCDHLPEPAAIYYPQAGMLLPGNVCLHCGFILDMDDTLPEEQLYQTPQWVENYERSRRFYKGEF